MPPLISAALVVLCEGLSVAALFPVIHAYCGELGGGAAWVGALFALVAAPKVVANPLWGRAADRFGRKPMLILVTLGTGAGSVLWAVAPSLIWLAVSRAIVGVFSAQAVIAQAVAADVSPPQRRAASMAVLGAAFGIALTLGPVSGGIIAKVHSPAAVGWFCAALQLTSLLLVILFLRETRPPTGVPREGQPRLNLLALELFGRRSVPRLLLITLLVTLGLSELTSAFGLFAQRVYHFDTRQTGYVLGMLGLLSAMVQGGLIRAMVARYGERVTCVGGAALMAGGFAWTALQPHTWGLLVATGLIAAGSGLAITCLTTLTSHAVGPHEQGAIMGLSQSATALGRAVGYLLGGLLFSALGPSAPFTTAAGLLLLAIPLLLTAPAPLAAEPASS